ncbi:hypothetical protein V6R86_09645 [Sphingomonas kaistensis]|uniref:Uncharacterized protein n=1 Tax=Sphingomonas kaistensis TaxID=298708 RepID=A0ABZ2G1F7_9SPHN
MPLLFAVLTLIFVTEILLFSLGLSALAKSLPISLLYKRLGVSVMATIGGWAAPIEHILGATLIEGPFAPWGWTSAFIAWALIALPSTGIFLKSSHA